MRDNIKRFKNLISTMIVRCSKCGMIRSSKDLVTIEKSENNSSYICFSCWNKHYKDE